MMPVIPGPGASIRSRIRIKKCQYAVTVIMMSALYPSHCAAATAARDDQFDLHPAESIMMPARPATTGPARRGSESEKT
jgi:hypothetical protein